MYATYPKWHSESHHVLVVIEIHSENSLDLHRKHNLNDELSPRSFPRNLKLEGKGRSLVQPEKDRVSWEESSHTHDNFSGHLQETDWVRKGHAPTTPPSTD